MIVFFLVAALAVMLCIILVYRYRTKREIRHMIALIERINEGDLSIDWSSMREGDLGILQNELYRITVKLRENAQQQRSDKEKIKEALADISHQIKTPLTTIRLGLEELEDMGEMKDSPPAEQSRMIKRRMKRAADHIAELVSVVLKLSKLEANAVSFKEMSCAAGNIVRLAIERTEALSDLKGIRLVINDNDSSPILADTAWQAEAISNILKNCIEHSPVGSCVTADISGNPMYVRIVIRDHGGGVPQEELAHIFERFRSIGDRGKVDADYGANLGVGIGLALAREIVIAQGGMIFARNIGDGMEFEVRYPKGDSMVSP